MIVNGIQYDIRPRADLSGADLRGADLRGASLRGANLSGANLSGADLRDANLPDADLRCANLRGASLRGANLSDANLRDANLRDVDLRGANLSDANLSDANLRGADVPPFVAAQTVICGEGALIGYKKLLGGPLCKLEIPADAKRSNSTGRKCRAEYAIVLEGEGFSYYDRHFLYKVGATVKPTEPFDTDRWSECASGIHFFLTREEAEAATP